MLIKSLMNIRTTYKEAESLIYQGLAAFSFSQILVFAVYLGFIACENKYIHIFPKKFCQIYKTKSKTAG